MRYLVTMSAVTVVLLGSPPALCEPERHATRRVEMISMGKPIPALASTDVNAVADNTAMATDLPFQVHDLSRRYVQYRMQQELGQFAANQGLPTSDNAVGSMRAAVSIASSIPVPDWMRSPYAAVPVASFAAGCVPLAYRPSGFLVPAAEARRAAYYGMMSAVACEHGIPTGLFDAMIIRESGYNPSAISSKNAFGFAQLMPGTAAGLGVNRFDPFQNMRGGARYLRQQLDRFGQVELGLAAYNAGPGRVRNGKVPVISETRNYVTNILADWGRLSRAPRNPNPAKATVRGRQAIVFAF